MTNKRKATLLVLIGLGILASGLVGFTYSAFSDKGKVLGSTFSVGSADLKFLTNLAGTVTVDNLAEELTGPSFTNIPATWQAEYPIKIVNNGTTPTSLTTHAKYATANDPGELRNIMYIEPLPWTDENGNGLAETAELGTAFGKKTITKWSTEGFDLGQVAAGTVKGLVLRFSAENISDTKQGKIGLFDFEFDSIGM